MEHKLGGGKRLGDLGLSMHKTNWGWFCSKSFLYFLPGSSGYKSHLESSLFSYGSLRSTENLQNNLESAKWEAKGDILEN